jgi:hypothetical protein
MGSTAKTQNLLEYIAITLAPIDKPFVRADLHHKPHTCLIGKIIKN